MITLTTAKARLKLPPRGKCYFVPTVTPGIALGYRRIADRAGTWSARIADGEGGNRLQAIGTADDLDQANGRDVLSFEQAHDLARKITRSEPEGRLTLARALEEYEASNKDRDPRNVSRVRHHLAGSPLLAKDVTAITVAELERWRDGIEAAPATVNRTIRILKAALNGVAERYPDQITKDAAWRVGLKQKRHLHNANNVVLDDDQVRKLIEAARELDKAFGLFVEVGAVTGARPSQMVRLEVQDLQADGDKPRLMMPTSKKGTGEKQPHIPVPITASLAAKLRVAAAGRGPSDPLLERSAGDAWSATSNDHRRPFEAAVERADIGLVKGKRVTFYSLRHSSIVRRIKLKHSLRTIAAVHDTSVVMIERHYSRYIAEYDDSNRVGLLELEQPTADVLPFTRNAV